MNKIVLIYISLLILLGSSSFSTQVYAVACQTGMAPSGGCTIDTYEVTYTMTGNISTSNHHNYGIYLDQDTLNTINMTGNISTSGNSGYGIYLDETVVSTINMTGNITTLGSNGYGIYLNETMLNTINMTGNISTSGRRSFGIWFNNSHANVLTISGDISTSKTNAQAIYIKFSDSNTITMTGNIETSGDDNGKAFYIQGSNYNTLNMIGNIKTSGSDGEAFFIKDSDSNTITMTGNIETSGDDTFGAWLRGSNSNTINMTGNITTSGVSGYGVVVRTSDSNTINMTGNISTEGDNGYGVWFKDADLNTINITGDINTSGQGGNAFYLNDANLNTINMTGNISTEGDNGYGVWFKDADLNTINITGDINTSGSEYSNGFTLAQSNTNTINMTGNIKTLGDFGIGVAISSGSDSNTITMTGDISTSGQGGNAFYLNDANLNTINFAGNITTSGIVSQGFYLVNSDSNTFHLSGKIHSLKGNAIELDANSQNNTFFIKRGMSLIGDLKNNGGMTNKLIFDMGKSTSYSLSFGDTSWTIEDLHKSLVPGSAKSMGVADIDNQAHILYRRMNPIHNVWVERQRLYAEGQRPTGYYMNNYYSHDKRDEQYSEISGNAGGVTVGYVLENTPTPMEVLVNFEVSQDKYGLEQTNESNSLLAGLFFPTLYEDVLGGNISAKVLVSGSENEAKRTVLNNNLGSNVSSEKISGSYTSGFISAGTAWFNTLFNTDRMSNNIILGADLVQAYNKNYTAGEYKVDSHNMTQIQSRAQYGLNFNSLDKKLTVGAQVGVAYQEVLFTNKQNYKIDGIPTSYKADYSNTYYTAGLSAQYHLQAMTHFYVDTKFSNSTDDIRNMAINFGFISRF